jgi:hypothetical protein
VALFNTTDKPKEVGIGMRHLGLAGTLPVRDLWSGETLAPVAGGFARTIPPHGAGLYRLG